MYAYKMLMLIVFGRADCPYTMDFVHGLVNAKIPFLYKAFVPNQTKEEYWNAIRQLYPSGHNFSFPTPVLFVKDPSTNSYKRHDWGTTDSSQILQQLVDWKDHCVPLLKQNMQSRLLTLPSWNGSFHQTCAYRA